jgi:hypothetical protein
MTAASTLIILTVMITGAVMTAASTVTILTTAASLFGLF